MNIKTIKNNKNFVDGINNQFPLISPPPLPETLMRPGKEPKPVFKIILGVAIGVVVLAGVFTAVLATRAWDPLWNPFRPKPEEVLLKALNNISAVKIMHSDTNFALDIKDAMPGENVAFALAVISDIDNSDSKNPKQQFVIDIKLAASSMEAAIIIEARAIGSDIYFNIKKLDSEMLSSLLMATLGADISQFKNVWVKGGAQSFVDLAGAISQIENNQGLGEKLQQIFLNNKLFLVKGELPDERVEGAPAYHYVLALDNTIAVKAFSEAINLMVQGQSKSNNDSGIEAALAPALEEGILGKILESVGEININIWIGKEDNLPYRFFLEKTIPLATIVKAFLGGMDSGLPSTGAITFKIDESFSKFSEPVQIKAPEDFRNASDLIAPLAASYQLKLQDTAISENILRIQSNADYIYQSNKSYYGLTCKNATIKPFCEEIKNIAGVYPTIKVSKTKYCAFSKLSTPGNYFCVDSKGYYEVDGANPGVKGYCTGTTFVCPNPFLPVEGIK